MQERISQLQHCQNFKEGLRNTCRINKISITFLNGLTIKKLRAIHLRTLQHYQINPDKARSSWFENQLRLFHWVLLIEAFFSKQLLTQFNNTQWCRLQEYFPPKNPTIFEYQAKKLLGSQSRNHSRSWVEEECQLLRKIMEDKSLLNRWNEVARRFYEESGKRFYRSSKQCRQQWFNHLDFSKIHGDWTKQEDKNILEFVLAHGRKWALICKQLLPHRTEHMIKNRFKSLLSKTYSRSNNCHPAERKAIRQLLACLKKGEAEQAAPPQENGDQKECIKKQLTFSSEKDLKSLRDPSQEIENSLLLGSQRQIAKNAIEQPSINQSIIHSGDQQQNKQLEQSIPLRPILPTQPHLDLTSPRLIPTSTTTPALFPQPFINNNFGILPFFPPFYAFVTPTFLNFGSPSPQATNE